jgi:hypothetical protein
LVGNELIEIGIGEPLARALGAVADGGVFERTACHMTVEGLDRTAELCSCFGQRSQAIRWAQDASAVATLGWKLAIVPAKAGFQKSTNLEICQLIGRCKNRAEYRANVGVGHVCALQRRR